MVRIIVHRGKLSKHCVDNDITNIDIALDKFWAEIDVRLNSEGVLGIGHDYWQTELPERWCFNHKAIFHCKDVVTLGIVRDRFARHNWTCDFFFHDSDDCTLTNRGHIWLHPKYIESGCYVPPNSYLVFNERMPDEREFKTIRNAMGICTDNTYELNRILNG